MRKYSDKFLHEYNKLNKAKIGIEFEFYVSDLSYYKTLELLNNILSPVRIHGFRMYHSNFKPDSNNFKLEPDLSGGSNMCELITGVLDYQSAKYYLIKILKFISDYGYTNDKCSIHINISFDDENDDSFNLSNLNILKLILNIDEEEIYRYFPSRKDNIYAKTIKNIIPFKKFDFDNISIDVINNNIEIPDNKYFGVNFMNLLNEKSNQRLEFRYLGGENYENNIGNILYFMDRFILDVYNSIDAKFDNSDLEKLSKYLSDNISKLKNFNSYDNFLVEHPSITLQVNMENTYNIVSSYYNKISERLFDLFDSSNNLKDCIINFDTYNNSIEIVEATILFTNDIKNLEFINCKILNGIITSSNFNNCEISNTHLNKCYITNTDVSNSKLISCRFEYGDLKNSYFDNGVLDGYMDGGVFRSGKIGDYGKISEETKIITNSYDNFFNTKYDNGSKSDKHSWIDNKLFKNNKK